MKKTLIGWLLTIVVITSTLAAEFELDVNWPSYKKFDYVTALAEKGNVDAQYHLGLMYYTGENVSQNYAVAIKWYRRASEQGHADAQFALGFIYDNGEGVPEDDVEAVKWYRYSAEQGHTKAQNNLGLLYFKDGEGIPENLVKAYFWFNLAAAQGNENAKTNKPIVAERMTRAQIAEAQKLSREFTSKHE